uniref:ATP-binding protein n=1 Tax=Enterobacter hormaechei TaxID=158836 RepID=UPI0015968904
MSDSKRTNLHAQENFYRPILEYRSASILLICSVSMLYMGLSSDGLDIAPIVLFTSILLFLLCLYRCKTAAPFLMAHWRVFKRHFMFVSLDSLRVINKSNFFSNERKYRQLVQDYQNKNKDIPERKSYFCDGFEWGPEHADRAYQIANLSSDKREIELPFVFNPIKRHFDAMARKMGGSNAIFAVERREPIFVTEDNWFGHTLITGNVGTGKTVLQRLLSISMLHLGHVVVVIDPKNDAEWRESLMEEAKTLGLPFYKFHPGQPASSVCIDVCNTYTNVSDLTSRLLSLVTVPGEVNPFVQYAKALVSNVISGLSYIESPRII